MHHHHAQFQYTVGNVAHLCVDEGRGCLPTNQKQRFSCKVSPHLVIHVIEMTNHVVGRSLKQLLSTFCPQTPQDLSTIFKCATQRVCEFQGHFSCICSRVDGPRCCSVSTECDGLLEQPFILRMQRLVMDTRASTQQVKYNKTHQGSAITYWLITLRIRRKL